MRTHWKWLYVLIVFPAISLHADDGASSIAVGGLVVMKKEPRITMAKEVLEISHSKVIADYYFRNDSDEDVITEVTFPIPSYDPAMEARKPSEQGFDDFRLWINGQPAHYSVQTRALLKKKDYTDLLQGMHIDVASFGHATDNDTSRDFKKLTTTQRNQLVKAGLIAEREGGALWKVEKKYHWQQTFLAHKVVHIRHEYTPVLGNTNSISYGWGPGPDRKSSEELKSLCIDGKLHTVLQKIEESKDQDAFDFYVDFILTTANTWKTPIEDFTLIVDRPTDIVDIETVEPAYVSFCWDGPVTKDGPNRYVAHAKDFVPKKELRIGFIAQQHRR